MKRKKQLNNAKEIGICAYLRGQIKLALLSDTISALTTFTNINGWRVIDISSKPY